MSIYLGVETSCDETAAAVVRDGRSVVSSCLLSQFELHAGFGGVVPEYAARRHLENINSVIAAALNEADLTPDRLSGVACTTGPGLVGGLLVGVCAAKAIAWSFNLPLIAVDHLLAHVCASYIDSDLEPPFIALLVSGGHTQIVYFKDYRQAELLGETLDDAAGEAFDKVGRLIGLPYPGGPALDLQAANGCAKRFSFPRARVPGYDFSFSGLKTAVFTAIEKLDKPWPVADLAASFQDAVVAVLVKKTLLAERETGAGKIVVAGGVAANSQLRADFQAQSPVPVYFPRTELCTDNAAMVAAAAHFCGERQDLSLSVYSRRC